ncbi:MAG: ATP synthase F0 subunit B [Desulfomonilia bacterium]|jgi:F-type H+-transporting ATPase subunit b|nr:ATP synthase F0 subunit B [Deltaproteobacteria bacterium]MDX9762179.1 ATP synthase F0 subunit B [Desulfomonilia bacterium]HPW69492.1 ATP synthase F0 subunit B [Deltaproteobacteria bacterium]
MKRLNRIAPLLAVLVLAVATVCMAAEGGEGGSSRIWDMVWRIVNFIILFAILWKLLADKIKKYFSDRRIEIAEMIDTADKARTEAEKQFADYRSRLQNIDRDIQEIRDAIMGELEGEKQRIIKEGKAVAERIIEQAKWSAEQEIIKAKNSLRNQVVDMAGDMASGLVTNSMTPEDQKRLIEEYLDKVGKEQ